MKAKNALSVFDGISCGALALQRARIPVNRYFAFENNKYAVKIADERNPFIYVPLGDVKGWQFFDGLPEIDILMAGFPCQSHSIAGNRMGLEDIRGELLYDLLSIIGFYKPKKLLLENVKGFLTSNGGAAHNLLVNTLHDYGYDVWVNVLNSSLVSAQHRERVYYTTWKVEPPEDRHIYLSDIIESGVVDREKSYCIDASYFKGGNPKSYFQSGRRQLVFENRDQLIRIGTAEGINGHDLLKRVYPPAGKSPTLNTHSGGNMNVKIATDKKHWRNLTVLECERLQNLPDGYTDVGVSNTQRYKAIGNGWTVDMVAELLKQM